MANASTNLTGAAREVQVLKIDGYSASKSMCTAKKGYRDDGFIESRWNVGGYEWEVRMYPATVIFQNGYGEPLFPKSSKPLSAREKADWGYDARWLALKLVFLGESGVRAALGCRLVDPRGVLEPSEEKSVSNYFGSCNSCTEAILLMETRDLAASGYLRGDSLSVECSITVLRELPGGTGNAKCNIANLLANSIIYRYISSKDILEDVLSGRDILTAFRESDEKGYLEVKVPSLFLRKTFIQS
ncbi:hypothetical protein ACQ4PT_012615 [Festuca glaucescens]